MSNLRDALEEVLKDAAQQDLMRLWACPPLAAHLTSILEQKINNIDVFRSDLKPADQVAAAIQEEKK